MPVEIVAQPPHHLRLGMLARRVAAPARAIACSHRCIRIRKEAHVPLRGPPAHAAWTAEYPCRLHCIDELSIRRRIARLHLPPRQLSFERGIECGLHLYYLHCCWNHLYRRHVSILRFGVLRRAPVLAGRSFGNIKSLLCGNLQSGPGARHGALQQSFPDRSQSSTARANRCTVVPRPTEHR